jgi:hypothetical protein
LGEDAHAHIFPYALRRLQKRHPNLKDLECLEAHEIRRFTESEVHDEDDTDSDEDSDSQNDFNEDLRADNDADGANVDDEDSVD